ncbi:MAG: hypothetical protein K5921_09100 [Lachnospiraceae bacterium]|nr:hypothetical protein [Lachnospiraceae bacterium]
MEKKDIDAIREMCESGMSLQALFKIFKNIDTKDIEQVYNEYMSKDDDDYVKEDIYISNNCS